MGIPIRSAAPAAVRETRRCGPVAAALLEFGGIDLRHDDHLALRGLPHRLGLDILPILERGVNHPTLPTEHGVKANGDPVLHDLSGRRLGQTL